MTAAMKFSIVTPTFNSERFIAETIDSLISQAGKFSVEFFIMDGGSTDGTQKIVQRFQKLLQENAYPVQCDGVVIHWHSEKDGGMYDAIKKGFSRATGDVYAWINSDDIYLPGAFGIVQQTLKEFPQISWLKGITSYINESSTIYAVGHCNFYQQDLIRKGLYGPVLYFIQQDSVFWRANLWQKSGGVDAKLTLAGDYFLWRSFAEFAPLYSLNAYVSCFRKVPNQKSTNIEAYFREIEKSLPLDKQLSRKFRRNFIRIETLPGFLRPLCYRLVFGQHKHHLVFLEHGVAPRLMEGEYFVLKDMI
jgi:glycosyltransferase involved in cell wall biosynthesis